MLLTEQVASVLAAKFDTGQKKTSKRKNNKIERIDKRGKSKDKNKKAEIEVRSHIDEKNYRNTRGLEINSKSH